MSKDPGKNGAERSVSSCIDSRAFESLGPVPGYETSLPSIERMDGVLVLSRNGLLKESLLLSKRNFSDDAGFL